CRADALSVDLSPSGSPPDRSSARTSTEESAPCASICLSVRSVWVCIVCTDGPQASSAPIAFALCRTDATDTQIDGDSCSTSICWEPRGICLPSVAAADGETDRRGLSFAPFADGLSSGGGT